MTTTQIHTENSCYGMYRGVRDAAWRLLLRFGVQEFPLACADMAQRMQVPAVSYERGLPLLRELGLEAHCRGNDGFALHMDGRWCIFFDDTAPSPANRNFTLAHELGHVFLGHVPEERTVPGRKGLQITRKNRREWADGLDRRDTMERDANMFAARMLSPACVLWGLDLHTAADIERVCGLPRHVARRRAERMEILYERNCFLKSTAERQLFAQLTPYILRHRPDGRLPEHCLRKLEECGKQT